MTYSSVVMKLVFKSGVLLLNSAFTGIKNK